MYNQRLNNIINYMSFFSTTRYVTHAVTTIATKTLSIVSLGIGFWSFFKDGLEQESHPIFTHNQIYKYVNSNNNLFLFMLGEHYLSNSLVGFHTNFTLAPFLTEITGCNKGTIIGAIAAIDALHYLTLPSIEQRMDDMDERLNTLEVINDIHHQHHHLYHEMRSH